MNNDGGKVKDNLIKQINKENLIKKIDIICNEIKYLRKHCLKGLNNEANEYILDQLKEIDNRLVDLTLLAYDNLEKKE